MYHIVIILSSEEEHLGCPHSLAIVNRAAMNIADEISVKYNVQVLAHIQRSAIAEASGCLIYSLLRALQDDF
jgi:GTP cyclohydrolase FolE2